MSQSFAPPGWENGMNRESVLAVVNMFNPTGVSSMLFVDDENDRDKEDDDVEYYDE